MPTRSLHTAARDVMRRLPGLDPSMAWRQAMDENPDLAARHHAGELDDAPATATTTINPGELLMSEIGRRVAAGASEPAARVAAFAAMPAAARAYHRGELVEVTPQQPSAMPADTYPQLRHVSPGIDPLHPAARFHFSTLRRLAPGEQRPAGAVGVEKFGTAAEGGGSFYVEAA